MAGIMPLISPTKAKITVATATLVAEMMKSDVADPAPQSRGAAGLGGAASAGGVGGSTDRAD